MDPKFNSSNTRTTHERPDSANGTPVATSGAQTPASGKETPKYAKFNFFTEMKNNPAKEKNAKALEYSRLGGGLI